MRKLKPYNIGERFGKWTLLKNLGGRPYKCLCKCECGNTREVIRDTLRSGKSNGCISCIDRVKNNFKHGLSKTPEYKTWGNMILRCTNPANKSYKYYGGRGIKVCDRWLNSLENFLSDMGKRPSYKYSIDRINGSGNYEPLNCRWATSSEQRINQYRPKKYKKVS